MEYKKPDWIKVIRVTDFEDIIIENLLDADLEETDINISWSISKSIFYVVGGTENRIEPYFWSNNEHQAEQLAQDWRDDQPFRNISISIQ